MFTVGWIIYVSVWFLTAVLTSVAIEGSHYPTNQSFMGMVLGALFFGINLSGILAVIVATAHTWLIKRMVVHYRLSWKIVMLTSLMAGLIEGVAGAFIATALTGSAATRAGVFIAFGVPIGLAYVAASCAVGAFCVSRWGGSTDKWESFDNL